MMNLFKPLLYVTLLLSSVSSAQVIDDSLAKCVNDKTCHVSYYYTKDIINIGKNAGSGEKPTLDQQYYINGLHQLIERTDSIQEIQEELLEELQKEFQETEEGVVQKKNNGWAKTINTIHEVMKFIEWANGLLNEFGYGF
ncbi:putative secreted protein [Wickerhamomyces ciferrii]|uniref:Secreted protein n=1 Tax=Wickerhamomyces ciferrii (strain ATCC 14091 / BCRC 22168 / CBS 111 / JCM 3599 / NBRC 0793 / NRRL Y-1031 F-60-10) TaxID=1206466 RepID=K0KQ04_WICCF|nr:uncharacterized protein BN7_4695 [Wickerhamomyces ciferrii]CCH45116.1 putative secreted protein [Wickerhamomyces ciferrii]